MIMDCQHTKTELRRMSHCHQIKLQCLDCGQGIGNAVKHTDIEPDVMSSIIEFDYEFRDYKNEQRTIEFQSEQARKREKWIEEAGDTKGDYQEYLQSEKWRAMRLKIIKRDGGICQGCLTKPIEEIHHKTYDHKLNEFMFQLVGLCRECHARYHGKEE
jgi:hypothetical protein